MNENGRAHGGADPEDIWPVEPDPLLEEAAVEIAEQDTGPRADDSESGAEHLAMLATPLVFSDDPRRPPEVWGARFRVRGRAVEAPQRRMVEACKAN
jgi:hypothetical protein